MNEKLDESAKTGASKVNLEILAPPSVSGTYVGHSESFGMVFLPV